jgi:4-hydroxy-4-methyl-2-oxoglutarate aldolase
MHEDPTAADFEDLASLGVSTLYEAAGRRGLVDLELRRIAGNSAAGPARTVRLGNGGNRAVHSVLKRVQPGEVLVVTTDDPQPIALFGELLVLQARQAGAAAILVDGAVRDVDALVDMGLPVWARWVRSRGAGKNEESSYDVPVVMGGAEIQPGDPVVLDGDGAVVIPAGELARVAEAGRARAAKEVDTRRRIEAGEWTFDMYGLG